MTNLEALHAAILTNPDEDTPRLAYADALDERGEPGDAERAEFIRVQCRKASLLRHHGHEPARCQPKPCAWCGEVIALSRRERELASGVPMGVWFNPAPADRRWHYFTAGREPTGDDSLRYDIANIPRCVARRGFVESVRCTAADWLAHADALVWRPGQTVECDAGLVRPQGGVSHWGCDRCSGTGRVSRPCPPTAQPITSVTLTTLPEVEWSMLPFREGGSVVTLTEYYALSGRAKRPVFSLRSPDGEVASVARDRITALLAAEWPGITFDIEPATVAVA